MQISGSKLVRQIAWTAWALAALLATAAHAEVYVVCEIDSGEIVFEESADESRHEVMGGPFPGERTASIWVEENCPDRRCAPAGQCASGASPASPGESWLVVCDPDTGGVGMIESPPPVGLLLLAGRDGAARQHADRDEARVWAEENCPSWRCDGQGRCMVDDATGSAGPATGGWVAGEVTTVTLSAPPAGVRPAPDVAGPATGPGAPPTADLSPLINTAKAAVKGCSFPAALASVDHMANFDPEHPFYVANRANLRRLSKRQRQTEQTVWRASSLLASGNLEGARDLAHAAADSAVSCQNQAVAVLLDGIDTAIEHKRTQRQLAKQKAMASLLPGLVGLSRALSGSRGGPPPDPDALAASAAATFGYKLPTNAADPCAFKFEYRNKWDTEPVCTCGGYRFDASQFRCVR